MQSLDLQRRQLFEAEYGYPREFAVRCTGTLLCAGIVWYITGWVSSLAWAGGYYTLHGIVLTLHKFPPKIVTPGYLLAIRLLTVAIFGLFLVIPSLALVNDNRVLSLIGGCAMACAMFYIIQRGDTDPVLVYGPIVVVGVIGLWVASMLYLEIVGIAERVAVFVGVGWVIFYFSHMMLSAKEQRQTLERASERVVQQEKMAAIGRLAGGIAHDFNNILTVIGGNLDLSKVTADPAEKDTLIDEARAASDRATLIVDQLLIYSRRSMRQPAAIDASRVLTEVMRLAGRLMPKSVRLSVDQPQTAVIVHVNENQLVTALLNLLSNAAYAVDGAGRVRLSLTVAPEVGFAQFRVEDDGPGIPAEIADKVFDPFFTTKPPGQGTGLGLSMALGFAEAAGGALVLEPTARGTTICLSLPLVAHSTPGASSRPLPVIAAAPTARPETQSEGEHGSFSLP